MIHYHLNFPILIHIPSLTVVIIPLAVKDAIEQFERRFKMVYGILRSGFLEKAVYTAIAFVPYLPSQTNFHPRTVKTLNWCRYADSWSVNSDALVELTSQPVNYIFRVGPQLCQSGSDALSIPPTIRFVATII
jgi:hypothetical protein